MPISLPPLSRRRFLAGSAAGLAAWTVAGSVEVFAGEVDSNRFALFSDTHIAGDPAATARGVNMTDHFAQAAREVLECKPLPAAVLVCGDCALTAGTAEDYRQLHKLVKPLRDGGVAVHLAMGNHDHRERFLKIVEEGKPLASPVEKRHVMVVESPHANWYLLDSLDETNKTPGVLGEVQLKWLAKTLDKAPDKPALVMVHHNPDERENPSGLVETRQLLDLLLARPHVKGFFYGHSHRWSFKKLQGLQMVNLPPVAYPFSEDAPVGWVDVQLTEGSAVLTMRCVDKNHPLNEKQFKMEL